MYHRRNKRRKSRDFLHQFPCRGLCGQRVRGLGSGVADVAQNLFSSLRQADSQGVDVILFEDVGEAGLGLAVTNRIIRAAGFDIIEV